MQVSTQRSTGLDGTQWTPAGRAARKLIEKCLQAAAKGDFHQSTLEDIASIDAMLALVDDRTRILADLFLPDAGAGDEVSFDVPGFAPQDVTNV